MKPAELWVERERGVFVQRSPHVWLTAGSVGRRTYAAHVYRWCRPPRKGMALTLPVSPENSVALLVLKLRQPLHMLSGRYWTPFRPVREPRMSILEAIPRLDPASAGGQSAVHVDHPCSQRSLGRQWGHEERPGIARQAGDRLQRLCNAAGEREKDLYEHRLDGQGPRCKKRITSWPATRTGFFGGTPHP